MMNKRTIPKITVSRRAINKGEIDFILTNLSMKSIMKNSVTTIDISTRVAKGSFIFFIDL
ncbi:MAG: hypothetical protein ABH836_02975 [Candidatus Omnitrophota bacterium]